MKSIPLIIFLSLSITYRLNAQEQTSTNPLGEPSIAYDYPHAPVKERASVPADVYYQQGFWMQAENFKLSVGGDLEIDGRAFFTHTNENSDFSVRRARIQIEGTWGDFFGFNLIPLYRTGEFPEEGNEIRLQFAYIETLRPDYFRIRVGLFREPFSLEGLIPDLLLEFNERSLGIINFVHLDDMGVMFYGTLLNKKVEYGLAVVNGRGFHRDNGSQKEYSERLVFAPFLGSHKLFDQFFLGVSLSQSHQDECLTRRTFRTGEGTIFWEWTGLDDQSVDWNDHRKRWGCDFEWYYGSFMLRGEYLSFNWGEVESGPVAAHFDAHSAYIETAYVLTGEKKGRNQWVIPHADVPKGWGAWEIAARIETLSLDPDSLKKRIAKGTSRVQGFVLALNIYMTPYVALKIDWERYFFKEKVRVHHHWIEGESVLVGRLQGVF